ncbi:MAG: DUF2911 domain-containing protein, partial [Bacteroidetes bacterium]|nr:DUF2911 domain-containing protein [Bacteroidota bacterium]
MNSPHRFSFFAFLASFALLVATLAPSSATAQQRSDQFPRVSPNAAVSQTIGVTDVRITYGRPSVRGRTIFGGLVPYDEVWRTGANEPTTITFGHNVQVQGQPLMAGTYAVLTIPRPDQWTVIFSRNENQSAFNYDGSTDALRVEVTPEEAAQSHEMMTFVFESVTNTEGHAVLYWADARVPIPITVNTPSVLRAAGNDAARTSANWQGPFQYATYALQNEVMMDEALTWINQSIAMTETYANLAVKARLLGAMGDYNDAVTFGERAIAE